MIDMLDSPYNHVRLTLGNDFIAINDIAIFYQTNYAALRAAVHTHHLIRS